MKIFLTNIPAFYKIRLYNELAKRMKILVIFNDIGGGNRNADFVKGDIGFEYVYLQGNVVRKLWSLMRILKKTAYDELIIGGWENIVSLSAPFMSRKCLNACIVESSAFESNLGGVKGVVKRLYMRRINRVYASGVSQARLARNLGFIFEIKLTGGCGLLNYVEQPGYERRDKVKNFLYVGRLAEEKNLDMLIEVFNTLPDCTLTIIGFGEKEHELKAKASNNIRFLGAIDNKKLPSYYRETDVFVLPSKSEPWGLVVEEALNNGCPVLVSDMVGCREALVREKYGMVFTHDNPDSLKHAIRKMQMIDSHNQIRKNIANLNFKERAANQISVYL